MKEAEAKNKWCPVTRKAVDSNVENTSLCLGSSCMMWREGSPDFETEEPTGECGFMPLSGIYVQNQD